MISVIVPVYNVEKYLTRCIESVIAQSHSNWELVLVDDGSPDDCPMICEEYAKKDNRIVVFHQPNGGVTSARRLGVEKAHGEWITFLDSDDYLPEEALNIYTNSISEEVDIIIGPLMGSNPFPYSHLTIEEYRKRMIYWDNVPMAPWCHCFRRTILNLSIFDMPREITKGQDVIMNLRISYFANKGVAVVTQPVYVYNQNDGSVTVRYGGVQTYEGLEGEFRFHYYWEISIPEYDRQKYDETILNNKINALRNDLLRYDKNDLSFFKSRWYLSIMDEIKQKQIKLDVVTYGLFHIHNVHVRKFWCFVWKVQNHIRYKLSH